MIIKAPEKRDIIRLCFILYCLLLSCNLLKEILILYNNHFYYKTNFLHWGFADLLINYDAGFIRRGIIGEMLQFLHNSTGADLGIMIHTLEIASTIALIVLVFALFVRKKLSLLILPTVCVLGSMSIYSIPAFRRDALMLLTIFSALYFYCKYNNGHRIAYYILFLTSSIFVILMQEASFFCFVPFIFLHKYLSFDSKGGKRKFINSIIFLLPTIIAMGAVCLFKGDTETANVIWASWQPAFVEYYGTQLPMSEAVDALTWETLPTMDYHFTTNYRGRVYRHIPKLFAWIAIYLSTFYLCANVNKVRLCKYEDKQDNYTFLTSVLILQFMSLLPMFTVLSCDLGRIVLYWTVTSFFIYALFSEITIPVITSLSNKINSLFNNGILSSKYLYLFLSLTIICPLVAFPIPDALRTSVIGNIYYLVQHYIL